MKINGKKAFVNKLLKALVISGAVVIAASNPFFGLKAIGAICKELKRKKWQNFRSGLYYLKYRGFIEVNQNPDGSYSVTTTGAGKNQARKYNLDDIAIKVPRKWDKHWRAAIFDIPAFKQKARMALLFKLKELNFIMLQKSIWVHPFECHNEVAVLAEAFGVENYVNYLTCSSVSSGKYLQDEFEKRNHIKLI